MKQSKQPAIPVHRLDNPIPVGIDFGYREMDDTDDVRLTESKKNHVHRDDYYIFFLLDIEEAVMNIDFEEIPMVGKNILYIRPGQVHFSPSIRGAKGYFLAIDSMLVEEGCKKLFEGQFATQRPIVVEEIVAGRLGEVGQLLYAAIGAPQTQFSSGIITNLANVFIGIIAEQYAGRLDSKHQQKCRSTQIAHRFRELVAGNFRTMKSPMEYARELNYSLSHLNESVKSVMGFPVSYWIHREVVLEAKRLLCYTDMEAKEIAFSLGYDDATYFSRLFSKVEGVPPGEFRRKFRE